MKNSRWIEKFETELDRKNIFCIYGNINDNFFYNKNISSIDEYFNTKFGMNISYLFNKEYFEKYLEEISSEEEESSVNTPIGNNVVELLQIIEKIDSDENNYIVIKDPKLFFGDYCHNSKSFSLRYFLEILSSNLDKKIIFVSEKLGDFPEKLLSDNPYTTVIYVDYPEEDERSFYIKECLHFFEERHRARVDREIIKEEFDTFVKVTSKRKLKDIKNIMNKAIESGFILRPEKSIKDIMNSYDFGEKESPWTKLDNSAIKKIEKKLKERVKGQDEAIEFVKKVVYRAKLNLNGITQPYSSKPIGVMFFTGPSGVGKTELAKALTECIFGDESAFKRFDMSEYKSKESINKLIGSDPGYVGYDEGGQLTNWIIANPYSIILFDEIDKADVKIWDTFLQILEDGRLTDNKGNTGYFNEAIIIFTSNIGNADFNEKVHGKDPKKYYLNALNNYFEKTVGRVEILNRFGENKIVFNHISKDVFEEIIDKKLEVTIKNIGKRLKGAEVVIEDKQQIRDVFMKKLGDSTKFGARLINSLIENEFINEFSVFYLENVERKQMRIEAFVEGDKIKFRC